MLFTDRYLSNLKPRMTPYRVHEKGADRGLCVQVLPSGTIRLELQYATAGRRRFLKLGTYPATSLAEARRRAREARTQIEAGKDPAITARAITVSDLFDWYAEQMASQGRRTAEEVRAALRTEAEPVIGRLAPSAVTAAHVAAVLRPLIERGAVARSNRLRSFLHRAFALGLRADHDPARPRGQPFGILANPVAGVPRQAGVDHPGQRVLGWGELKAVWDWPCSEYYRDAIRLILLTGGQRSGEVLGMRFDEVRGDLWELPPERTKNRRAHVIPLHQEASDIIDRLRETHGPRCPFLFPAGWDANARRPIPSSSLSKAAAAYTVSGVQPWTPRDLRRTVKTRMGELGVSKQTRDRLQNHSLWDVSSRHYDRWDYLPDLREAVEAWCERLTMEVQPRP